MEALYDKVMYFHILWMEEKFFAKFGTMLVSKKIFPKRKCKQGSEVFYMAYNFTDCIKRNPAWEANIFLVNQENSIVLYRCPRRNVPDFTRAFLMIKYTDITQNTDIQSWTVTEIMAREKCGHLAFPRTLRLQLCSALTWQSNAVRISVPAQAPPNAIR